jgi:hypothetical protein
MVEKREIFWVVCLFALLMIPSALTQISQYSFNNTLTAENITFTGNENATRYLTVSRYANVTSAYMNFSGFDLYPIYMNNLSDGSTETNLSFSKNENLTVYIRVYNYSNVSYSAMNLTGYSGYNITDVDKEINWAYDGVWSGDNASYAVDENWGTASRCYSDGSNPIRYCNLTINNTVLSQNANLTVRLWNVMTSGAGEPSISIKCWQGSFWQQIAFFGSTINANYTYIINTTCLDNPDQILSIRYEAKTATSVGGSYVHIYEDMINWMNNSNTSNTYLEVETPDGSREWNNAGQFINESNISFKIVSNKNCSCEGCIVEVNSCLIPLKFHSDTGGIIKIKNINIKQDIYPTNTSLELGTYDGFNEWNYSGTFIVANNKTSELSSSINLALASGKCNCTGCSLTDNNMNCSIPFLFHSDSIGSLGYSAMNITYTNKPYFNSNQSIPSYSALNGNVTLQVNITDLDVGDTISYCNFTALSPSNKYAIDNVNGTFFIANGNYIWNSSTIVSNESGIYIWNATCKSSDGFFARASGDFASNDLTKPSVELTDPINGTYATSTVMLNKIVSDDIALSSCWYNLNDAGNTTISLTSNTTLSLTNNDYFLILYCRDSSFNENSSNVSFVVYVPPTVITPSGGGGGAETEKKCSKPQAWFIDRDLFSNLVPLNTYITRNFCLLNNGTIEYSLKIACDDTSINATANICKFVNISETAIILKPNIQQLQCVYFTTTYPKDTEFGSEFYYGLRITDQDGCESLISVANIISMSGSIVKLGQSTSINTMFNGFFSSDVATGFKIIGISILLLSAIIFSIVIGIGLMLFFITEKRHNWLLYVFFILSLVATAVFVIYI